MVSKRPIRKTSNTHDNKLTWASHQAWEPNKKLLSLGTAVGKRWCRVPTARAFQVQKVLSEHVLLYFSVLDDGNEKQTSAVTAVQITVALRSFKGPWVQLLGVSMPQTTPSPAGELPCSMSHFLVMTRTDQWHLWDNWKKKKKIPFPHCFFLRYCHKSCVQTLI